MASSDLEFEKQDEQRSSNQNAASPDYSPGSRLLKVWLEYLAVVALPFILLSVSSDWLYPTSYNNVDSWLYYGYQRNLHRHMTDFQARYFGDRLGWILPIKLANKWLHPLAAHRVLKLSYLILTLLAFYSIAKYATNSRAAFLTTMIFACYPITLNSAGWYYVDWPAVCYCVVGAYSLVTAARAGPWGACAWSASAGMLLAGAVFCYPLIVVLFPPSLILFLGALWREGRWRGLLRLLPASASACMGAALAFLACLLAWHSFTGNWNYMTATRNYIAIYTQAAADLWLMPSWWSLRDAFWLVVPAAIVLGSILTLLVSATCRSVRKGILESLLLVNAVLFAGLLIALRYAKGYIVLDYPHFAYIVAPFIFLALAPLLSTACARLSTRLFVMTAVCCLVLFASPLLRGFERVFHPTVVAYPPVPSHLQRLEGLAWLPVAICVGCTIILGVIALNPKSSIGMASALTVISCATAVGVTPYYASYWHCEVAGREAFRGVVTGAARIEQVLAGRNELICFSQDDPLHRHFISIASCELTVLRRWYVLTAPQLPKEACETLRPGEVVVVLSSVGRDDIPTQTRDTLQTKGFLTKVLAREESALRTSRYALTFLEITGRRDGVQFAQR
jgi:hypothetical protein